MGDLPRTVLLGRQGHVERTEWLQDSFAFDEERGHGPNSFLIIHLDANFNQDLPFVLRSFYEN